MYLLLFIVLVAINVDTKSSEFKSPVFPILTPEEYKKILTPPKSGKTVRVVLDTDFDNEVDDYFPLAWLLLQMKYPGEGLNPVKLESIHIAPYSFEPRLMKLLRAFDIYEKPVQKRTKEEKEFLKPYKTRIEDIIKLGITREDLKTNPHYNGQNEGGVDGSYDSVIRMLSEVNETNISVFKGAKRFMSGKFEPVENSASRNLISLAQSSSPEDPLYVITIGCLTNIASALLQSPEILPNIVVIWDATYPTNVISLENIGLNLDEDLYASQLLFSSGVPLVYIPGYYIAQQLSISKPELEAWIEPSPFLGKMLSERYMNNPLFPFFGININSYEGKSWVIWDICNVAWILDADRFVYSKLVVSPTLSDDQRWVPNPNGHLMREAYQLSSNDIWSEYLSQQKNIEKKCHKC